MKKVTVVQKPEAEVPTEVLAQAIIDIAAGMKKLRSGRLNDRALILLIQSAVGSVPSPVSQRDIRAVLDAIQSLEAIYIRKKQP